MRASQLSRRLEKLSAKIRPNQAREFTLEELCRHYWRMDKRGFKATAKKMPAFEFFVDCFQREDAERASREQGPKRRANHSLISR
jgi:hypothetical protein